MFLHFSSGGHNLIVGCVCSMEDRNTTFLKLLAVPVENQDYAWPHDRRRATIIPELHVSRGPSSRQITSLVLLFFHSHLDQLNLSEPLTLNADHHNPNSHPLISGESNSTVPSGWKTLISLRGWESREYRTEISESTHFRPGPYSPNP